MEEKKERLLPILHKDQYYISQDQKALTPDEKAQFLEMYYKTGNLTKSAQFVGRDRMAFMRHLTLDKAFSIDFYNVKQAIKNDLEETMLTNALKEKGYMDRITWLRTNFPQEYNPNADRNAEDKSQEAIKALSQKLNEYELIPKKKVIEGESDAVQE